MGRGGDVLNMLTMEELLKIFCSEGRAVISVFSLVVHTAILILEFFGSGTGLT